MTRAIPVWKPEPRTRRFACVRVRISSWSFLCRELWRRGLFGSANGTRTRVSALRGQRPRPLDDSARVFLSYRAGHVSAIEGQTGRRPGHLPTIQIEPGMHYRPRESKARNSRLMLWNGPSRSNSRRGSATRIPARSYAAGFAGQAVAPSAVQMQRHVLPAPEIAFLAGAANLVSIA